MEELVLYKPNVSDIAYMQELVAEDVKNGNILERTANEMATTIRSYVVAKVDNKMVGFAALHIHTVELAEIRSLIVDKEYRGRKIGPKLIEYMIKEAKELNLKKLLVLTYKKQLFERFNFKEIPKESIPETKIWADCIKCKHFPVCDEVSLTLDI
ncbi:MAG: N-acetyltransferase [Campylobacterota bacterium]|nr:N-acetyltransferase [Campylobacterota bacterium]